VPAIAARSAELGRRRDGGRLDVGGGRGDDLPVGGCEDLELEPGLDVRLVEAGVDPVRVGGLELGVEVGAPIDGVDEAVQALAGVHVQALGDDLQLVVSRQVGQGDARTAVGGHRVEIDTVQPQNADRAGDQIDERAGARLGAGERERGRGQVAVGVPGRTRRQVEPDDGRDSVGCTELDRAGAGHRSDQLGPLDGFVAAQIGP
jgi:hypothetical protein